jgi:hypothetical protein
MGRSISPMEEEPVAGSDPTAAPRLIVPMSLQLVIPRRVALQQSSPPLHQLSVILKEKRKFEKEKPLNGKCANTKLSQPRGSPQNCVAEVCRTAGNTGFNPRKMIFCQAQHHERCEAPENRPCFERPAAGSYLPWLLGSSLVVCLPLALGGEVEPITPPLSESA